MDVTGWLRATPRPLIVTARGGRALRLAVERLARERGWERATAAADADLLIVCGVPDAVLDAAVERVWAQLPSPRARADVVDAEQVATELDRAHARLTDPENQRAGESAGRPDVSSATDGSHSGPEADDHTDHDMTGAHEMAGGDDMAGGQMAGGHDMGGVPETAGGHDMAGGQMAGGHDMAGGQMAGGHDMAGGQMAGGHDMAGGQMAGGHEMAGGGQEMAGGHEMHMMHGGAVAGLPMADRAPDRDGLTLDVLHITLGPVLVDWPAAIAVRVTLQGDVVQAAQVEVLGEPGAPWEGPPAAMALDSLARLLSVCGAATAARTARRLRDDVLADAVDEAELRRFARRLRRSRTLRWATDGVGVLDDTHGDQAGDATRRWLRWLDTVEGSAPAGDRAEATRTALAELPALLEGRELASARVLVASLDPDPDLLVAWAIP